MLDTNEVSSVCLHFIFLRDERVLGMLPLVSEQLCTDLETILRDPNQFTQWQKQMIHQLQESNPEINAMLLTIAQTTEDPKAAILAGFSVYQVLHWAYQTQRNTQLIGLQAPAALPI